MPITIGFFFPLERINHFPFISNGNNSFGIRPVWYKSMDLERIKDVYRGTTVISKCSGLAVACCDYHPLMGHHSSPRLDLLANGVGVFCSPGVGRRIRVLDGYRGPRRDLCVWWLVCWWPHLERIFQDLHEGFDWIRAMGPLLLSVTFFTGILKFKKK
jgi:hypothetical protein